MDTKATLRVHGHGDMEVKWIFEYLKDFEDCYNSISTFDSILESKRRAIEIPYWGLPVLAGETTFISHERDIISPYLLQKHSGSYIVGFSDRLILKSVVLQSPGIWEFLGKLNPLEVIRHYLNDRHERKKDIEFRNEAEERKLHLENMLMECEVLNQKMMIAERMGYSRSEIEPLFSALVADPLEKLDGHQDRHVIEYAEPIDSSYSDAGDGFEQNGSSVETENEPA